MFYLTDENYPAAKGISHHINNTIRQMIFTSRISSISVFRLRRWRLHINGGVRGKEALRFMAGL